MKKSLLAAILALSSCFAGNVLPSVAKTTDTVSPCSISGYGQVLNVSNTGGSFNVPTTVTSGNGYGVTIKNVGSGSVTVSIKNPNGVSLWLGGGFNSYYWTLAPNTEKAWNFSGIVAGNYVVSYTVIDGPSDIICHIYG